MAKFSAIDCTSLHLNMKLCIHVCYTLYNVKYACVSVCSADETKPAECGMCLTSCRRQRRRRRQVNRSCAPERTKTGATVWKIAPRCWRTDGALLHWNPVKDAHAPLATTTTAMETKLTLLKRCDRRATEGRPGGMGSDCVRVCMCVLAS